MIVARMNSDHGPDAAACGTAVSGAGRHGIPMSGLPCIHPRPARRANISGPLPSPPFPSPQLNKDPYAPADNFWQTVVDNLPTATGKAGANNLTSPATLNLTALLVSGGVHC